MTRKTSRRRYVKAIGAASIAALAGCSSSPSNGTETSDQTTTATSTSAETTTTSAETTTTSSSEETYTPEVEPHGSMHIHGQLTFEINGKTFEIGDLPYNWEKDTAESTGTGDTNFHFHGDDGSATKVHVHARDVTFGYGLNTLPKVDAAAETFTFRGTTYDASEAGTTLKYMVDGEETDLDHVFEVGNSGFIAKVVVDSDKQAPETVTPSTTLTPGENSTSTTSTSNSTTTNSTTSDY